MIKISPCPTCGSDEQYQSDEVSAGGGYAPNYLPGLGSFFRGAEFRIVMCRSCGLTRFFASSEARQKVTESNKWSRYQSIG